MSDGKCMCDDRCDVVDDDLSDSYCEFFVEMFG